MGVKQKGTEKQEQRLLAAGWTWAPSGGWTKPTQDSTAGVCEYCSADGAIWTSSSGKRCCFDCLKPCKRCDEPLAKDDEHCSRCGGMQ